MEFPKITTGNGNSADLAATTNNRLEIMVVQTEKLTTAIGKLEQTIIDLDTKNSRLQGKIFWLTIVGIVLTATQIIPAIETILKWLSKK